MKNRRKNKRLKTITSIAVMGVFLSASCFDGENIVLPLIVCGCCLLWLALFCIANCE